MGCQKMIFFSPDSPKKTSPTELRAFQHDLFCGRCLFLYSSAYFMAQKLLVTDFESALFLIWNNLLYIHLIISYWLRIVVYIFWRFFSL